MPMGAGEALTGPWSTLCRLGLRWGPCPGGRSSECRRTNPQEALYRKQFTHLFSRLKINNSNYQSGYCMQFRAENREKFPGARWVWREIEENTKAKIHLFLIIICLIRSFQNARINWQLRKQTLEMRTNTENSRRKTLSAYM